MLNHSLLNISNILNTDGYKTTHHEQLPPDLKFLSSYAEARGGAFPGTILFGPQSYMREYLTRQLTMKDINEAELILKDYMPSCNFNRADWEHIVRKHDGFLPIRIDTADEGTLISLHNVMVQVRNTAEFMPWLASYVETALLRATWYPTTVATNSYYARKDIERYWKLTVEEENWPGIMFSLHDFGARGVSSNESAGLGGLAHLISFMGTDTIASILAGSQYYDSLGLAGSIPASEHSTMTAWGRDRENMAYQNMLNKFGKNKDCIFACVSDSYNLWVAAEKIWGTDLREKLQESRSRLVVRPDSGEDIVGICLRLIDILADRFGYYENGRGYKVLRDSVRIIQGDGMNPGMIRKLLAAFEAAGWSSENIAFGMGGALLQGVGRDDFKFAQKASAGSYDGVEWFDMYKEPVTDLGKSSKRGIQDLVLIPEEYGGGYATVREDAHAVGSELHTRYFDGELVNQTTMQEIRERAWG